MDDALIHLCQSTDLTDSGLAVPFDVVYAGQTCRAFAVRFEGQVQAYLNRCTHVAMEMDYQPDRFFDTEGRWLLCANMPSNNVAIFSIDAATGALKAQNEPVSIPSPSCIRWLD